MIREELNDISAIYRGRLNDSPTIFRRYIVPKEISLKYRRYLAIIAINDDNHLYYFCTAL